MALAGAALLLAAVVMAAFAYSQYLAASAESVKQAALQTDPRAKLGKRSPRSSGAALPVTLAMVGLAFGFFHPLLNRTHGRQRRCALRPDLTLRR